MEKRLYTNSRYFPLDCIRALSILLIIFFHYNCATERFSTTNFVFFPAHVVTGNIGVSLFFLLSGASLMLSTQSNYSPISFYKKRIRSIFPLFWTTYILFVLSSVIIFHPNLSFHKKNPLTFALTILGLDGFLLYKIPNYYIIGEWFLGCILILYATFPVIRYLFNKGAV
jgi:peptidoglycan/LPS O-acetylase OafA/YrhL